MKFDSLKRGKQAGTRKSSVEENDPAAKKTDSSETDEEDSDLETEDDQEIDNDPDERKLRDYERRERFVFRYGEKLEADVEAKAMLKPVVRACRRAQCERLKNHALELDLEALEENVDVQRKYAERIGIRQEKVEHMVESEFAEFEAERALQRRIASHDRERRCKEAELGIAREIVKLDAELSALGRPAEGHPYDDLQVA